MVSNKDLFEEQHNLPEKVQEILLDYSDKNTYEDCERLLVKLKPLGYTFDYGLDGVPTSLKTL